MAIGWWTALKVIPWGQVIEHAPVVLKGARRLMERQHGETTTAPPVPPGDMPVTGSGGTEAQFAALDAALADTQARLAALAEQQRQGDELLAELAEQNARLVAAVDVLRLRSRLLIAAVAVLAAGGAALAWRVFAG